MITSTPRAERYAKVIDVSKRVRWEIDRDVIRGRAIDYGNQRSPWPMAA